MLRSYLCSLLALGLMAAGCGRAPHQVAALDPAEPERYQPMCRAALVAAKEFSRRLRTSTVADEPPVIIFRGPPVRIRCAVNSRQGAPGEVTADIRCLDAFDRTCVVPVTASLDGRIVQGPGRAGPDRWP